MSEELEVIPTKDAEGNEIHYEFSKEFEDDILTLALRDTNFMRRSNHLLRPEYFSDNSRSTVCRIALDFFKQYHTSVPKAMIIDVLKENIKKKIIREEEKIEVINLFKDSFSKPLPEKEAYEKRLATFVRKQAVTNAIFKSIDLLDRCEFDKIQNFLRKALEVGVEEESQPYKFFGAEEIEARTKYRKDIQAGIITPNGITTGWKRLDNCLYQKGWGKKELSLIMGGAKMGKSMALVYFAQSASRRGHKVLFLTLEVSQDIVADRLDACISGVDINKMAENPRAVEMAIKSRKELSSNITIHEFASGTLRPEALRSLLERYRSKGETFDLVCVDYADLMTPNVKTRDNPIENSRQIYVDLRAIAFEFDCAVLTATQTNRAGMKEKVAGIEHISDDINKARTADIVISINRSEEEKRNGEATLYFAASRNQESNFSIRIKQDLSKAQFITDILGVE